MTGDVSNDLVYDLREAAYSFGWQDAKFGKKEQPPRELRVLALERQVREMLNERDAEVARLTAERARYLAVLQWYATAAPWEVNVDGGVKGWEVLEATGRLPPTLANPDREAYAEHVLPYEPRTAPR
jgi:hypothetical protein